MTYSINKWSSRQNDYYVLVEDSNSMDVDSEEYDAYVKMAMC